MGFAYPVQEIIQKNLGRLLHMTVTKNGHTNKKAAKRTVKKKSKTNTGEDKKSNVQIEIISIIMLMLAVFTYVSINKFQGLPQDHQFIGILGTVYIKGIEAVFGQAGLLVPAFFLAWSINTGLSKKIWNIRMWGVTILALDILLGFSLYEIPAGISEWEAGFKGMGGGYLGGILAFILIKLIGKVGAVIILVFTVVASALLIINQPVDEIGTYIKNSCKSLWNHLSHMMFYEEEEKEETKPRQRTTEPVIIDHFDSAAEEEKISVQQAIQVPEHYAPQEPPPLFPEVSKKPDALARAAKKNEDYQIPPLDILSADKGAERTLDKKNIKESISILEDTFASFGINVKVNQVSCGPAVTRYELSPGTGVKISKIISLTDDLQLNLAAPGIRIEAPIPGKSAVGIEVPNRKISSVGLRRLLSSPTFTSLKTPLAFALGEDISGNSVSARLNDMPHLLIAGSTGSGKSVCLNCIIMSLLYNAYPDELKLVFIDPKMVELTVYNGIPHLMTPVVTDPKKASVILKWMVTEMEKRYQRFAEAGVRDIQRYNQDHEEKLPYIVIVIDELADLMMVAPVEVEDSICRLAQMARAAGMHLIVATQRPSVDVVTGTIKANIPSRIAFAVSSQADSRTILDASGAEKLLGKGDMLFFPVGAVKPFRVQGAYVSDQDIETTVDYIREQTQGSGETGEIDELEISLQQIEEDYGDDLFWDAVSVFVDNQKASVSFLQRRLRIGYARAARLVDLMEDRGIVSELDNNKRREVLINSEQLEMLQARNSIV